MTWIAISIPVMVLALAIAGSSTLGVPTLAALVALQTADTARALRAKVTFSQTSASIASGALLRVAGGHGVLVATTEMPARSRRCPDSSGTVTGTRPPRRSRSQASGPLIPRRDRRS
jgi:hypothetical protein